MTPKEAWAKALADVIAGRKPSEVAPIVAVSVEQVRRWLRGSSVPCGWRWRALVIEARLEDQWAALSAARDAVERKPTGRPRKPDAELKEAAERRALARRKVRK